MITNNAKIEVRTELKTFVEALENVPISNFEWLRGGYRNADIRYALPDGTNKVLVLKRAHGNWRILKTS